MLNDLLLLKAGAHRMGIVPTRRHPQVQAPGKVTALRVCLDREGGVAALHVLPPDRMARLWTFRDGNHNAFPFVQVKEPLLGHAAAIEGDDPGAVREVLSARVAEADNWPGLFSPGLIERCRERRADVEDIDPASACVPAVLERGVAAMSDAGFTRRLAEAILDHEADGRLSTGGLALAKTALVGDAGGKGVALYFDVAADDGNLADQSTADTDNGRSIHASNIVDALSRSANGTGQGACGLTGMMSPLHEGPFPKPTLPVVGGAYIYARNVEATPASLRYGSKATYPVRSDLPPELAGTVEALTEEGRKGRSWRSVPSEHAKESDLLIAAIEVEAEIALADALAGGRTVNAVEAESNETDVEQVLAALDAKLAELGDEEPPKATLLLLRKIDPGNVKAILSRQLSTGELRTAAQSWVAAQKNAPPIKLRVKTDSGERTHRPYAPAPLQLPPITRTTFLRGGMERAPKPAPGLRPQDALALFLDDTGADRIAAGALSTILRRQGGLLIETAHTVHCGNRFGADNGAALRAVGALGLLLAKSGRDKEDYMNGNAYRLGQLFAAVDAVHAGYCADVRDGSMPPTLLGNEVLGTAQRSPVKGLELMALRFRPYQAWARSQVPPRPTADGKDLSPRDRYLKRAFWGFRDMERLCRSFDLERLAEMPDDRARAEMILGYLAGSYEAAREEESKEDDA